jgi:hypothetical protein
MNLEKHDHPTTYIHASPKSEARDLNKNTLIKKTHLIDPIFSI